MPKREEPYWKVIGRDDGWTLAVGLDKRMCAPEWRAKWFSPFGTANHTSIAEADVGRGGLGFGEAVKKAEAWYLRERQKHRCSIGCSVRIARVPAQRAAPDAPAMRAGAAAGARARAISRCSCRSGAGWSRAD